MTLGLPTVLIDLHEEKGNRLNCRRQGVTIKLALVGNRLRGSNCHPFIGVFQGTSRRPICIEIAGLQAAAVIT